jgi:hypothetical protein
MPTDARLRRNLRRTTIVALATGLLLAAAAQHERLVPVRAVGVGSSGLTSSSDYDLPAQPGDVPGTKRIMIVFYDTVVESRGDNDGYVRTRLVVGPLTMRTYPSFAGGDRLKVNRNLAQMKADLRSDIVRLADREARGVVPPDELAALIDRLLAAPTGKFELALNENRVYQRILTTGRYVMPTLTTAVIAAVCWWCVCLVVWWRVHTDRAGRCRGCGYDLAGLGELDVCPECGRHF